MSVYAEAMNRKVTPQSEPIPGEKQVENSAGGYTYQIDQWDRLHRFLIIGTDGGTYYTNPKPLTREAGANIERCLKTDPQRAINLIVAVSQSGRAPKNDPAIFALALASASKDPATRRYALLQLPMVCRIPTHLFHFLEFLKGLRGWSRQLRTAVSNWYLDKPIDTLAYHLVKYQSRDGWSNRDVLRKAHPKTTDPQKNALFRWAIGGEPLDRVVKKGDTDFYYRGDIGLHSYAKAFDSLKAEKDVKQVIRSITDHSLTREMIPTQFLKDPDVWEALLPTMPMGALVRSLPQMSKVGLLVPMSDTERFVQGKLKNAEAIKKSRLHPFNLAVAQKVYASGQGRGSKWTPTAKTIDALEDAFYLSFGNIQPTGKRTMVAVDVSGSMGWEALNNSPLNAREASAIMAMAVVRTEPNNMVVAFSGSFGHGPAGFNTRMSWRERQTALSLLPISARQRLSDIVEKVSDLPFGATDCALPVLHASENPELGIESIIIYTDNETWAGQVHPSQAVRTYRQKTGINLKFVVCGMTATYFTIADPEDPGMLDVVGFDSSGPQIISEFCR